MASNVNEDCRSALDNVHQDCIRCGSNLQSLPVPPKEPVYIFIDNSNLWTEAKKKAAREQQLECSEDPRLRLKTGKLVDLISGDRAVAEAKLYASEPPPVYKVWKNIEKDNIQVKLFERSKVTGKEKQVDQQLVADITETVCDNSVVKGTIAVVSGDADILPAIMKAIEKSWKCEVWTWQHCCAKTLTETAKESPLMKFVYLDNHWNDLTSREYRFFRQKFNKEKHSTSAVIVKAHETDFIQSGSWEDELSRQLQWPFRYFFAHEGKESEDLVLVFLNLDCPIEEIMRKLRYRFGGRVKLYIEYTNQLPSQATQMNNITLTNRFSELQGPSEEHDTETDSSSETDVKSSNDGFKVVERKRKAKTRMVDTQKNSQPCKDGHKCALSLKCPYYHTKEEERFFRAGKQQCYPCKFRYSCRKKEKCQFAHDENDSFCRVCGIWGHLEGESKKCRGKNNKTP